jgi:hypothetical protein
MNKQLKTLLQKYKQANTTVSKIQRDIDKVRYSSFVPCAKCSKKMRIKEIDLFRINWKNIVAEYQYICRHCKYVNRVLFKSQGDNFRLYMNILAGDYFKDIPKTDVFHDANEPAKRYKFVNNFYLETLIDEEVAFQEKQSVIKKEA